MFSFILLGAAALNDPTVVSSRSVYYVSRSGLWLACTLKFLCLSAQTLEFLREGEAELALCPKLWSQSSL